ncbi:MAG: PAS domain S-box protein [Desulfomonilaceae bacterium]
MQDQDKTREQLIDELNEMRLRIAELETAEPRGQDIEKILKESEKNAHLNRSNLISESHSIENQELASIIDIPQIQSLMDDFYKLTNIGIAILDLKGNILVATGWQDICTKFHRIHPDTLRNCVESDLHLTEKVNKGEYLVYKCKNNMWDMVTPIVMGGKRVGNLYLGQFLFEDEVPDIEVFEAQAQQYGFNKDEYLAALNIVPRWSRDKAYTVMTFYSKFASILGELSYSNLNLTKMLIESKKLTESLRESSERYRSLVEHLPQRIFIKDRNSVYLSCNSNYAAQLGITPEQIVGKDDFDFHPPELAEAYRADDQDCMSTGMVKDIEEPYLLAGEERWAHTIKAPFHDSQGRIIGVIGIFEDITERKQVELALRESEQRLGLALEGGALGLWDWNLKTGLGVWGDRTTQMLGYEPNELDPNIRTWKRAVHPDDWEKVSEVLNGHLSGRLPFYEAEYRMLTKSAEWKWLHDRGKVVEYDKEGRPQRITGTTLDVTEHKKAEEELRKSEEKYRRLVENAYDIVYTTDANGLFTFANPACVQHIRYSQEELIGRNYLEFIPEEYRRDIRRFYGRQFVKKISDTYCEFPFVTKNGETRWYGQKTQLLMEKGIIVGFQSIARDITERKQAVEALRESEERFRGMFEKHSAVMLLIEPVTGKILDANKAAEQFYGYTKSQLLSMSIQDINTLPRNDVEATRNLILKEQCNYFIFPHRLANGEVRTVEVHSSTIEQNGALQLFSIIHDITDRERLEQERLEMERKLLHTQKLESLAVMAGGIAHDFNNQLAVVLGNLELALMDLAPDSGVRPSIQNAVEAAKRSAELSRKMQVYTGNVLYSPVNLDLNEFLTSNLSQLKLGLPKNITINSESFNSLPNIKGDPEQIRSLLRNILVNACEAIGDKDGEARFSTGVMDCDTEYLSRSCPLKHPEPGRFVFLEVSDTGCGMDAETQRQLFDPFFSTKFWCRGLGMAEALGIVKSHHGAIIVDSGVGEGTTIHVLFPVLKEAHVSSVQAMDLAEPQDSATDIVTGKKTILIVEDEAGVRDLSVKRLEVLGYNTIVAVDGEEGVSVFRERLNEIDLVMLDLKMPRMGGVEAFEELIRIKPDVRVILCSGYTEDVVMESFPGQRPAGVLHKPYNMEDLKGELDRLLGAAD